MRDLRNCRDTQNPTQEIRQHTFAAVAGAAKHKDCFGAIIAEQSAQNFQQQLAERGVTIQRGLYKLLKVGRFLLCQIAFPNIQFAGKEVAWVLWTVLPCGNMKADILQVDIFVQRIHWPSVLVVQMNGFVCHKPTVKVFGFMLCERIYIQVVCQIRCAQLPP